MIINGVKLTTVRSVSSVVVDLPKVQTVALSYMYATMFGNLTIINA